MKRLLLLAVLTASASFGQAILSIPLAALPGAAYSGPTFGFYVYDSVDCHTVAGSRPTNPTLCVSNGTTWSPATTVTTPTGTVVSLPNSAGVLYGNITSIGLATSANVLSLWSGSCSASTYLRGDGSCNTPAGSGTGTVTNFVTPTVPSWLTATVTSATTTPTLTLAPTTGQSAHQVLGTGVGNTFVPMTLTTSDLPIGNTGSTVASGADVRFLNALSLNGTAISSLTGLVKFSGGSPFNAAFADVVALWTGCSSGLPYVRFDGTCDAGVSGTNGTVTALSVTSVPSWLTASFATATTTPALTIGAATGQTAHRFIGTGTGASFGPVAIVVGDVPTGTTSSTLALGSDARFLNAQSLNGTSIAAMSGILKLTSGVPSTAAYTDMTNLWTSCTTGYLNANGTCGTSTGTTGFATVTAGTNTTAAMVIGSGASIAPSGTGTIAATNIASGATLPGSCTSSQHFFVLGASGIADQYWVCLKDATNTTHWIRIL